MEGKMRNLYKLALLLAILTIMPHGAAYATNEHWEHYMMMGNDPKGLAVFTLTYSPNQNIDAFGSLAIIISIVWLTLYASYLAIRSKRVLPKIILAASFVICSVTAALAWNYVQTKYVQIKDQPCVTDCAGSVVVIHNDKNGEPVNY
jgi:hypothetical protein